MAVSSASKVQFEFMLGGGSPAIVELGQQSDTTGWRVGAPVGVDASGHFFTVATGPVSSATGVFGIALENSCTSITADGSHKARVLMATPMSVFSAVVAHATTASATVQASQIGKTYALVSSGTLCSASSEVWVIDAASTQSYGAYVIANKDATGTAYGRNYFVFCNTYSTASPWGGYATA